MGYISSACHPSNITGLNHLYKKLWSCADLDLSFAEVEFAGDLPALLASDVRVADELVLQNHRLVARVRFPLLALARLVCNHISKNSRLKESFGMERRHRGHQS